jgi:catechol 2,3-dioxygenase-like lactoylglutathione lyase family enzyme
VVVTASLLRTIPALPVANARQAVDFYRDRLGFEEVHQDEGYGIVRRDDAEIHLWAASDEAWRTHFDAERPIVSGAESFLRGTSSCRIEVSGVDELFAECRDQGVLHQVSKRVDETDWGAREFAVVDLDNNLITLFEWQSA